MPNPKPGDANEYRRLLIEAQAIAREALRQRDAALEELGFHRIAVEFLNSMLREPKRARGRPKSTFRAARASYARAQRADTVQEKRQAALRNAFQLVEDVLEKRQQPSAALTDRAAIAQLVDERWPGEAGYRKRRRAATMYRAHDKAKRLLRQRGVKIP